MALSWCYNYTTDTLVFSISDCQLIFPILFLFRFLKFKNFVFFKFLNVCGQNSNRRFSSRMCNLLPKYLRRITRQDVRIAPAYFSPEYKYFDQHLQTVKNETTV